MTLTSQDLQQQYIAYFGRPGDPDGIDYWLTQSDITDPLEFALKISAQDEYQNGIGQLPVANQINQLYVNLFGRNADQEGLEFWSEKINSGESVLGNLAYELIYSATTDPNGDQGVLDASALSNKTQAAELFTSVVATDDNFKDNYDNELAFTQARGFLQPFNSATEFSVEAFSSYTAQQVQTAAIAGLSYVEPPEPPAPLTPEEQAAAAEAAEAAAAQLLQQTQLQAAQAQISAANAQLALAQQQAAEVATAAAEEAAAAAAALNAPTTYKFTKTTDALEGQGGDDKFTAVIQDGTAAGTTLFPGDSATGGDGIDTLSVSIAGTTDGADVPADYTLNAITTDGIEKFFVSNFETTGGGVDNLISTNLMTGLTTVGLSSSGDNGDTEFTLLKNFVDAEMRNGGGDLTLTYDNPLRLTTATDDVQNLTVSALSAGTFKSDGFETLNITSELTKSTLTAVDSDSLKTLNLSGDVELVISGITQFADTDSGTTIDATIDGSTATGKLNITLPTANSTVDVKGGSADDTFNFKNRLDKNDVADGGDGEDTIKIDASGTALDEEFKNVTNFEKVATNETTADQEIDVSKLPAGITSLSVDINDAANTTSAITATIKKHVDQEVVIKRTSADNADFIGGDADGVNVVVTESDDNSDNTVSFVLDAVDTGDADTGAAAGGGVDSITAANYETVSIESKANKTGTMKANEVGSLSLSTAKTLTVTGNTDLYIGGLTGSKLKTVDFSALDGKLTLTGGTQSATYKFPNKKTVFTLTGAQLTNADTIEGGTHEKDELMATSVTGKTATSGKFSISGIETINLMTTGDNTFDLSNVTGAKEFNVTDNTITYTNVDIANADLRLGSAGTAVQNVTAVDASGDSDVLRIGLNIRAAAEGGSNGNLTGTIEADDIETLDLLIADNHTTAADTHDLTLTKFKGTSIVAAQHKDSAKDASLDLNTVYKTITSIDTSALKGATTVSATNATSAVTFNLSGKGAVNATGSEWADTYTVTESESGVDHTLDGGVGSDTATLNLKNTAGVGDATSDFDPSNIGIEKLTLNVKAGDDIETTAAFSTTTTEVTLTGGNSLSKFDVATNNQLVNELEKFDASGFGGNVSLEFADNTFDDTVEVIGAGASTDAVKAKYTATATYKPKVSKVKTLDIESAGANITTTLDLSNSSDVSTIKADLGTGDSLKVTKVDGQTLTLTEAENGGTFEAVLNDDSGSADTLTFKLDPADATAIAQNTAPKLKTSDVETVTIKGDTAQPATIDLSEISMDAATATTTLKLTTGKKPITVIATHEDINVIDASGLGEGGSLIQSNSTNAGARSRTDSVTYTGSDGSDTLIMANKDDVIDAGTQPTGANGDTLVVAGTLVIGGIEVDLSKTDDQVTTWNGTANTAIQKGFESVDLSNMTANSEGAVITANKVGSTITGLTSGTNYVTGGAGNDTFYVVNSGDVADLKAGTNTVVLKTGVASTSSIGSTTAAATTNFLFNHATSAAHDLRQFNLGTGTNTISATTDTNISAMIGTDGIAGGKMAGISTITMTGDGTDITVDKKQIDDFAVAVVGNTTGNTTELLKVDLGDDNQSFNFSKITSVTNAQVQITGGTGADTVVGTSGDDIINLAAGANVFTGGPGNDAMTAGGAADTFHVFTAGSSTAYTAFSDASTAANVVNAGDTFTFGNGVDVIAGPVFTGNVDDLDADGVTDPTAAPTTMLDATNVTTAVASDGGGVIIEVPGVWDPAAKTFTVGAAAGWHATRADFLLGMTVNSTAASALTNWVVLDGADADIAAADIV